MALTPLFALLSSDDCPKRNRPRPRPAAQTGALVGEDRAWRAVLAEHGALQVDTLEVNLVKLDDDCTTAIDGLLVIEEP